MEQKIEKFILKKPFHFRKHPNKDRIKSLKDKKTLITFHVDL